MREEYWISWFTLILMLFILVFLFSPFLVQAQEVEIKIEDGVKVIYNPARPSPISGRNSKVVLRKDIVIGEEIEKEDYWFSFLNSLAIDDYGNIYTLDPKEIKIRVFDPKLNPINTFHSFEKTIKSSTINPYSTTFLFTLSNSDNLIWMLSSKYEIHVVDSNGQTKKRIMRDYDPVKITSNDKKLYFRNMNSRRKLIPIEIEFPDFYPVAFKILVDEREKIYVQTYSKNKVGEVYHDIFDKGGRYIAKFVLPEEEQLAAVKKNKLYCIVNENNEAIPLVKCYILDWK